MGMQHSPLHRVPLQQEGAGGVMVEVEHQPPADVAAGLGRLGLGVVGTHAGLLEQVTQAQDRRRIKVGVVHSAADADPGFRAGRHADPQAPVATVLNLGPEGPAEGLGGGGPHPMLKGMGKQGAQRAQMVPFHGVTPDGSTLWRSTRREAGSGAAGLRPPSPHPPHCRGG